MNSEELTTRLYEKMQAEQQQYQEWLLTQPPNEILNHAYEYTIREDILMAMEEHSLTGKQARALLKSPCPLEDVYKHYSKQEHGYMDDIRNAIDTRANAVMREELISSRREER